MKYSLRTALLTALGIAALGTTLHAQVPRMISYQGLLTDASGQVATNGSHILTLTIYDAADGGHDLYSETHTVEVVRGTFSVIIGSVNPLPPSLSFDRAYFLGVSVDGRPELAPRMPLLASPYSIRTTVADHAVRADAAADADRAAVADALSSTATGVVRSINGKDGDLQIVGGGNTSVTTDGSRLTIYTQASAGTIQSIHSVDAALQVGDPTGPAVTLSLVPGGITEPLLGDAAVTWRKLRNGAVTTDKIADNSVTTAKLNTGGAAPGATLISSGGDNPPFWGNPIAIGIVMPFSDTVNSPSTLWSISNSGSGGAGRFSILNPASSGNALTARSAGSGNALAVDGRMSQTNGSVLFSGQVGTTPASGPGTRMMWVPLKSAFRAGYVNGNQWDDGNIGDYSVAMGYRPLAGGNTSTALGSSTLATGDYATAIGRNTSASGESSTALGYLSVASGRIAVSAGHQTAAMGDYSTATGYNSVATGDYSFASGQRTEASGPSATAMGWSTIAQGIAATALGEQTQANGDYSTALGLNSVASGLGAIAGGTSNLADGDNSVALGAHASTNGYDGTFVFGDNSGTSLVNATADNQVVMRASGGVHLHTDAALNSGLRLYPGGTMSMIGTDGTTPVSGPGQRMMFIGGRGAFRAGVVTGNAWDDANIGDYSVATGYNTTASGGWSTAFGSRTTASGPYSTAMGSTTNANGFASTSMGWNSTAIGTASTAIGEWTTASGNNSLAGGRQSQAFGNVSMAIGENATSSGDYTIALGRNVSTNNFTGTFIFGDNSTPATTFAQGSNQFIVRADGGTIIYSKGDLSSGVTLANGAGAWATVSDRRRKENFRQEDGESVLARLMRIPVTTWNYRSQSSTIRHMGPMAQDFHAAFGLGESDTTITTTDIDGVNMIAIQALTRRTDELDARTSELEELRREVVTLRRRVGEVEALKAQLEELRSRLGGSNETEIRHTVLQQ